MALVCILCFLCVARQISEVRASQMKREKKRERERERERDREREREIDRLIEREKD